MTIINDDGSVKAKSSVDAVVECCTALRYLMKNEGLREEAKFRILCGILFDYEQIVKMNNDSNLSDNVDVLIDTTYQGIELIKKYINEYKGDEE